MKNTLKWNVDDTNTLVASAIGGILLGANLGSTPCAVIGGLVGIFAAIKKIVLS